MVSFLDNVDSFLNNFLLIIGVVFLIVISFGPMVIMALAAYSVWTWEGP